MILNYKLSNYTLFNEQIELDMIKQRGERLENNYITVKDKKVLKTAIIYGANNSGKSNFLTSLKVFRDLVQKNGDLSKFDFERLSNFLTENYKPIQFEIEFYDFKNNSAYTYGIDIISKTEIEEYFYKEETLLYSLGSGFIHEDFSDVAKAIFENIGEGTLFYSSLKKVLKENVDDLLKPIDRFFAKIWLIDFSFDNYFKTMNYVKLEKDILLNSSTADVYNNLLSNADINLTGKSYIWSEKTSNQTEEIKVLDQELIDWLDELSRIHSNYLKYNGEKISKVSDIYDSVGTKRFSRLAIEILSALQSNKILIVDEIDNSLHYKLVKELINFFHNNKISNSQLIMSSHDVKTIDSNLFRKEQINIISRFPNEVEMYSLADFKSNSDIDLRPSGNYEKFYTEGRFGGLPNPNFYEALVIYNESQKETITTQV